MAANTAGGTPFSAASTTLVARTPLRNDEPPRPVPSTAVSTTGFAVRHRRLRGGRVAAAADGALVCRAAASAGGNRAAGASATGDPAAEENAALADTIAAFDAATAEEARRRRTEEMAERWCAERQRQRMEWELQYRERQEAIERQEAVEHEAADQQRAIVESFESEKKLQDNARAREEARIRRVVELSLQAAQQGRAGDDALLEQRRLLTALRLERRRV
nr:uncharacterized protein LOC127329088 [Lolium perenne]